jgi:hypothetical protein
VQFRNYPSEFDNYLLQSAMQQKHQKKSVIGCC